MAQIQKQKKDDFKDNKLDDSKVSSKEENVNNKSIKKTKERTIGRWRIGATLGKGGYSWVKKGHDKKTNKCVALKFMRKADKSWEKEQTKQVVTEIECLKQIKHPNVLKLYAYNLNAKYPTTHQIKNINTGEITYKKIDTILLVLEYAPGGEIFDILYYTHALESVLARTYFRQAIFGLEACHNAGIAHRDIKAQNLLLDSRFNLKICDFGLSKIYESDKDSIMKTSYVGTRGYQAPELLLNKTYNESCDIFSLGVVLFILINGYPPFEQALESDRWFNPLVNSDNKKFWKLHRQCKIRKDEKCKDMLARMLAFDPKKRITINELKKHPWFNGKYLEGKNLIKVLRQRHREMEKKRREDGRKLKDLQQSIRRAIVIKRKKCDEYPIDKFEGCDDNEQYSHTNWKDIIHMFESYVTARTGACKFDEDENQLSCEMKFKVQSNKKEKSKSKTKEKVKDKNSKNKKKEIAKQSEIEVKFTVKVFESRDYSVNNLKTYLNKKKEEQKAKDNDDGYNDTDDDEEKEQENTLKDIIYVVKLTKTEGDTKEWLKLKSDMLLRCQNAVNGLPKWINKIRDDYEKTLDELDNENDKDNDDDDNDENDDDDYEKMLKDKKLWD